MGIGVEWGGVGGTERRRCGVGWCGGRRVAKVDVWVGSKSNALLLQRREC